MANQVEVLSLDINTSALVSKMTETRNEIEKLKASQKELIATNQQGTDAFSKNEAQLKNLQSSYNSQRNVVAQLTSSTGEFVSSTQALTTALGKENTSVDACVANNKELKALRNQLNASTVEGAQAIANINAKLDENTTFIKANVSAAEQQKMAIGDYKDQITEALGELNIFNGGLSGFISKSKEAGGVAPFVQGAFGTITTAIGGMIKASLAFIATPLGAALAAIAAVVATVVGSFKFMQASMNSTEEGSQKLARVTATISGVFKGLWNIIKPLGEFMGRAFIAYFDAAATAIDKTAKGISAALKFVGLKGAAASLDNFTGTIKKNAQAAAELSKAEGELGKRMRDTQNLQDEYENKAEKLRQLRDDESRGIKQRIVDNTNLGNVLKQQSSLELSLANEALKVAQLNVQANEKSKESLDKLQEAKNKISEINNRITGQESEQLVNINSLRKEAADKAKEASNTAIAARQAQVDKAVQANNEELALYIAQNDGKKKSLADELAFEQGVRDKKLANNEFEYTKGKISKTAYETAKLNITNEFARKQVDIAVANADKELEIYLATNQSKLDNNKFLNDTMYQQELDRLNNIKLAESAAQKVRLDNGVLSAEEYALAIKAIDDKYAADKQAVQLQKEEEDKTKAATDLQNKIALDGENFQYDLALQTEQEEVRYQQELADAEKTGADTDLIKKKHAENQKQIEADVQQNKLSLAASTFGNLASILGKETKAGKAAAIAQTTIDTYKAATAAYSALAGIPVVGPALGAVAAGAAVVSGLANVKKIASTKEASVPTRAGGGSIPTLRSGIINNGSNLSIPLSNGDDTLACVRQGEMILNQEQQARAGGISFFKSIGVPTYATGGYAGTPTYTSNSTASIDYDRLAQSVAQAYSVIPAPVVSVTDIAYQQNRIQVIENYANLQ